MSVSLTSSGLYLEPRVYISSDGVNYGTPKFVSGSTSLGGGSWTGIHIAMYPNVETNVSSSSGGGFTSESPNSISRKGGGLNVYEWFRHRVLLLYCRLHKNFKPSYRSYKPNKYDQIRYQSSVEWRGLLSVLSSKLQRHLLPANNYNPYLSQHCDDLLPTFLNLHLVKEVA